MADENQSGKFGGDPANNKSHHGNHMQKTSRWETITDDKYLNDFGGCAAVHGNDNVHDVEDDDHDDDNDNDDENKADQQGNHATTLHQWVSIYPQYA